MVWFVVFASGLSERGGCVVVIYSLMVGLAMDFFAGLCFVVW